MKNRLYNLVIITSLIIINFSCKSTDYLLETQSNDIEIIRLSKNVFQHISYLQTESWGKVACNGLIVVNGDETIIFDTPVDYKSSKLLIDKLLENGISIVGVVPTHFHIDCVGGLKAFSNIGTVIYTSKRTEEILQQGDEFKDYEFTTFEEELNLDIGSGTIQLSYLGAGHTTDNIVGYYSEEKTLFGGCLVKAVGSMRGNLADADVNEWSNTVRNVIEKYPNTEIVVPGHGKTGGIELLDYTIELFEPETK